MSLWERMAELRFRLHDCITVTELLYRGRSWFLLRNTLSRQQFRLSKDISDLLAKMDGQRTLAQIYQEHSGSTKNDPDVRRELLTALNQLQSAGMLDTTPPRDLKVVIEQHKRQRRGKRMSRWLRLLSPRIPLLNPDRFLSWAFPSVGWLFHPAALVVSLLMVLFAGLQALIHWEALALYGMQRLDDPFGWLLLMCCYPLVKGLHELGHGFAAKTGGAEVNEMGITLLVFLPVPYVDASAASAFKNKYQRMLVSAAGIIVELLLASIAMFIWLNLGEGPTREAAFAIMLIGGVSTLLFNGNPLLRFDGYYVLADAIEIPNLATRAARYYGYLGRRYLLGLRSERAPYAVSGERRWLLVYGAASTAYRLIITIGIALFLIDTIPTLGYVLATWLILIQVLLPLGRQLHLLFFGQALLGRRPRALAVIGGLLAVGVSAVTLVPFPSITQVNGVVLLPEEAVVRAKVEGFLERQLMADGTPVRRGDVLFMLVNPELDSDILVLRERVRELVAKRNALGFNDRVAREIHRERLMETRKELEVQEKRHSELVVRSPTDGILRVPFNSDRNGRLVSQGDLLAYLEDASGAVVRVAASQQDASRIQGEVESIFVRLADRAGPAIEGRMLGEIPLASDRLPSPALGSLGGGAIQVDTREERGIKALQKIFTFDVTIPFTKAGRFVGSRAYVRFEHPAKPLFPRWYDELRRMLMEKIGW